MTTGWTIPSNRACIKLQGPDAVRFLNGQVSNDVSIDLTQKVIAACVCSMKGKVEALVRVTAGDSADSLLIETEAGQSEAVFQRLDRYLIADDCELLELEAPPALVHLVANDAPDGVEDAREHWRYGLKGFDIFGDFGRTGFDEIPDSVLTQQKMLHGIPEFGFEITGEEFPAGLGLDRWAVDFHKGCYLGQEVVSRIESAGKIPRRLRLFSTTGPFKQGQSFENDSGREIAMVPRDSIEAPGEAGGYLTTLLAKDEFENEGFNELTIEYPAKL